MNFSDQYKSPVINTSSQVPESLSLPSTSLHPSPCLPPLRSTPLPLPPSPCLPTAVCIPPPPSALAVPTLDRQGGRRRRDEDLPHVVRRPSEARQLGGQRGRAAQLQLVPDDAVQAGHLEIGWLHRLRRRGEHGRGGRRRRRQRRQARGGHLGRLGRAGRRHRQTLQSVERAAARVGEHHRRQLTQSRQLSVVHGLHR